jgi:NAD(P)H-hydrate epimerase
MKLVDAATMRELDRRTIEDVGIPGIVLMEAAGRGAADAIETRLRHCGPRSVLVLCGPGNNGGDGFVVARHLADRGFQVAVALMAHSKALKGDARTAFDAMLHFQVEVVDCPGGVPPGLLARPWGAVVDALFGTGLARHVEGPFAAAVESASGLACLRVAIDLPTGVDADTGAVRGAAFDADLTVTFGAAKIGHASHPGRAWCGEVEVVPIGIPRAAIDAAPGAFVIEPDRVAPAFAPRDPAAFKNTFGHVAVVGGMPGKAGAALLAGMAAVRTGAGLVTVATSTTSAARVEGRHPELMVEGCIPVDAGALADDGAGLAAVLQGRTAIAIGPGLGTDAWADRVLEVAIDAGVPIVIDADALTVLAREPGRRPDGPCVVTPHPGEAARILGTSPQEVQADRVTAARALAQRTRAVAVLKGAGTVVASPDGRLAVNATGGPALATAGTGDVLAGVVAALLGRGIEPFDAACAAVHVHGRAGDLAAAALTEHSVSATDVLDALPGAIAETDAHLP